MRSDHEVVEGRIEARWTGSARALIALDSGAVVEAEGAEELADLFSPGDRAYVYFDANGQVQGWMLAEKKIGFNFRGEPD